MRMWGGFYGHGRNRQRKCSDKLVQHARMRRALIDIEEFRDDIKAQVFDFFGQIAPPLVRIAEVKKRVGEVNAKQVNDQSLKIAAPITHCSTVSA